MFQRTIQKFNSATRSSFLSYFETSTLLPNRRWGHSTGHRFDRTNTCSELNTTHIDSNVTLWGWVQSIRNARQDLVFVTLRDHTGIIQVVAEVIKKSEFHRIRNYYY